jgi:hypothetical protein
VEQVVHLRKGGMLLGHVWLRTISSTDRRLAGVTPRECAVNRRSLHMARSAAFSAAHASSSAAVDTSQRMSRSTPSGQHTFSTSTIVEGTVPRTWWWRRGAKTMGGTAGIGGEQMWADLAFHLDGPTPRRMFALSVTWHARHDAYAVIHSRQPRRTRTPSSPSHTHASHGRQPVTWATGSRRASCCTVPPQRRTSACGTRPRPGMRC